MSGRIARARTDERGIALAVALFALIVIGALVSGSLFAGRLEQQSGQNVMFAAQALEAAEAGLSEVLAGALPAATEALPTGGVVLELETLTLTSGLTAERQIIRLSNSIFFVRSTGTRHDAVGGLLATRRLGLLVRVTPANEAEPARFTPLAERAWVQLS